MLVWLLTEKYVGDNGTGVGESLGESLTGWWHAEEWN